MSKSFDAQHLLEISSMQAEKATLRIPTLFRDKGWANSFRKCQDEIGTWMTTPLAKSIELDLTDCRWIDPIPLMALGLEATRWIQLGAQVSLALPQARSESEKSPFDDPYGTSPNRMLRFLRIEGALSAFRRTGIRIFQSDLGRYTELTEDMEAKFEALPGLPAYVDSTCIHFRILEVPSLPAGDSFAADAVAQMLEGVDRRLRSRVSPPNRRRLMYKIRLAIQELLHNAQEHAYENEEPIRLSAIYARYRIGGQRSDRLGEESYNNHIVAEQKFCPKLERAWLDDRPGCVELFALDRGIGLANSLQKPTHGNDGDNVLKRLMQSIFLHGQSRKPSRVTEHGGLYLLYQLLSNDGDFVRVLDNGTWYGSSAPGFRLNEQVTIPTDRQTRHKGLVFQFRLGWKESPKAAGEWLNTQRNLDGMILEALCATSAGEGSDLTNGYTDYKVIDERFSPRYCSSPTGLGDKVLWLPSPHRMKWDILRFLETEISIPAQRDLTLLVIADIPDHEAITFEAALANTEFREAETWPERIECIVLATNRFRFMTLRWRRRRNRRHGFDRSDSDGPEIRDAQFLRCVDLIKWHDSHRLWEEVNQHAAKKLYLPEEVVWSRNSDEAVKSIRGYLDFPQTFHVRLCAEIYRVSLARLFGIYPEDSCELVSIDRLTRQIVQDVYSVEAQDVPTDRVKQVAVGSILVSGTTLAASGLAERSVHFFVHPDSPKSGGHPALLFWLGSQTSATHGDNLGARPAVLERIGRTAAIGAGGWKSIEIPRFDETGGSIATRNPTETYIDLQSSGPVIMKFGHWTYEGHHDFLTLNLTDAVQESFFKKNALAEFLVREIFQSIGLTVDDVDNRWARKYCRPNQEDERYAILAYRSHPSSERILEELARLANERGREKILSRSFALLPIRARWGGSAFLIPPLVRERIRDALAAPFANGQAVVLDDAAITGRTITDVHASLVAQGAKSIKTIAIANRVRSPSGRFGKEILHHYWRIDLPVMGRDGSCRLCHALDLLSSFSSKIVADGAKAQISLWQRLWGKASPVERWDAGLDPLPLPSRTPRRFCFRPSAGRHLAEINLTYSTGLALHAAEVHAMTGRDDYVLRVINRNWTPEIVIELAATHIFLYGDELDSDISGELIAKLFVALSQLRAGPEYGSLAALAIVAGLSLTGSDAQRSAASVARYLDWNRYENYVATVLLAYLLAEDILPRDEKFRSAERLLSVSGMGVAGKLRQMYRETRSATGYAHSEPLSQLEVRLSQKQGISAAAIRNASDSCARIVHITNELGNDVARLDGQVQADDVAKYQKRVADLDEAATTCRRVLDTMTSAKIPREPIEGNVLLLAKSRISAVLTNLLRVADYYFFRMRQGDFETAESFEVKGIGSLVAEGISWREVINCKGLTRSEPQVRMSEFTDMTDRPKAPEVWIVWHRHIESLVKDLLMNALWANEPIPDPWRMTPSASAHMWYSVSYRSKFAVLSLANRIQPNETAAEVFLRAKEGCARKNSWYALEAIGGKVELPTPDLQATTESSIYQICIHIPYAEYLAEK